MPAGMHPRVLALLLALATAAPAAATSAPASLEELQVVGSGELRWFGLEVYDARLLSPAGRLEGLPSAYPVALEITYRRNISSQRLVRTTKQEWGRLGPGLGLPGRAILNGWLEELGGIWPDVSPGDRLIALVEPAGATRFYGNAGLLGTIEDPDFGPAFLGIWLHPDTRAAELRAELLGERR
jgi:hypothetical protein